MRFNYDKFLEEAKVTEADVRSSLFINKAEQIEYQKYNYHVKRWRAGISTPTAYILCGLADLTGYTVGALMDKYFENE